MKAGLGRITENTDKYQVTFWWDIPGLELIIYTYDMLRLVFAYCEQNLVLSRVAEPEPKHFFVRSEPEPGAGARPRTKFVLFSGRSRSRGAVGAGATNFQEPRSRSRQNVTAPQPCLKAKAHKCKEKKWYRTVQN